MKFTGLAVVALLAITSSASAIPEPIAEITQLNITSCASSFHLPIVAF